MKTNSMNNKTPTQIFEEIKNYDIISFDIFDTLIFRPFHNPKDLFRILSEHHNCLNFYSERIKAEKEARKIKTNKFGHYEVTLEEIYKELNKNIGIDIEYGCKIEFEKELEFAYPNPYMQELFNLLKKNNKKIIIVSDMYLNKDYLEKMLNKCGYKNYYKLFVSCEYDANKRKGKLFEIVKNEFQDKKIVHIGDKYEVDCLKSQEYGFDSLLYDAPTSRKKEKYNMTATISSLYHGIIYNKIYNGFDNEIYKNVNFKYGYEYCGIFVLGYVNWIHKYAVEHKLQKILFLSRDGYILKKAYDVLFDDIPSEYVLWSRYASFKANTKSEFSRFLWQFVSRKVQKEKNITVKEILKEMGAEFLIPDLKRIGIYEDSTLKDKKTREYFILTIKDHAEFIFEKSNEYSKNAKEYYEKIIGNDKKIGIVDIGYRASGAISLINLFKEWNIDCDAKALIAFGIVNRDSFDDTLVLNDTVNSYVFSNGLNKNLCLSKDSNQMMLEISIIEILLTAAPKPSFHYFEKENGKIIPIYEEEIDLNYEAINALHDGIIDFINDYKNKVGENKYLLNIPGYDSFLPIKSIFNEEAKKEKFAKDFKNYVYSYLINASADKITYFSDIYKEYKKEKNKKSNKTLKENIKKMLGVK